MQSKPVEFVFVVLEARRMLGSALPAEMKALTAWTSCTIVTMLLANSSRSEIMLRARTTLRPMKMSGWNRTWTDQLEEEGVKVDDARYSHPLVVGMLMTRLDVGRGGVWSVSWLKTRV